MDAVMGSGVLASKGGGTVRVRTIRAILVGVAIIAALTCATVHAQDATMTDGEACTVLLRSFLPALRADSGSYFGRGRILVRPINGGSPMPSGIRFRRDFSDRGGKSIDPIIVNYIDVIGVDEKESQGMWQIHFQIPAQEGGDRFINLPLPAGWGMSNPYGKVGQALRTFVSDAHAGHPYDCHEVTPAESASLAAATVATELAEFQQKAATWQAINPKPPVSDEVTKKRLLAEDAVQEKNLSAAGEYYRAGIAIDPTWAPGWYNAALISAELKNYSAAGNYMKHYLILVPDASDAPAAKERVLLWEGKDEQTGRK